MSRRVSLGVSGHRLDQLDAEEVPRLERALARIMDAIEAAARVAARREPVRMRLVSALAEGTDRIAAHAALARDWRLVAPLPFPVRRYLKDFATPESRSEFLDLLDRADGYEPVGRGGYLVVGEMILEDADVLMILWNGNPPRGPGGTADVAARALEGGIPVIWLPPQPRRAVRYISPMKRPRKGVYRARFHRALEAAFAHGAQPPAMHIATA